MLNARVKTIGKHKIAIACIRKSKSVSP